MKKFISVIISFALLLAIIPSISVFAVGETISAQVSLFENSAAQAVDFQVSKDAQGEDNAQVILGDGISAITYTHTHTTLIVPKNILVDGITYDVVGINDFAFENFTEITNVDLSSEIASIGENAFAGCTNLTHITIPATSNLSQLNTNSFELGVDFYFLGDYNPIFSSAISNIPDTSNIYITKSATDWDTVSRVNVSGLTVSLTNSSMANTNPVNQGDEIFLNAQLTPEDNTKEFVRWTSTNEDVVFHDENSAVTGFIMPDANAAIVAVFKTTPNITFKSEPIQITYNENPVSIADLTDEIIGGDPSITWYNATDTEFTNPISAPTNAGDYVVAISLLENDTYAELDRITKDFTIIPANQSVAFTSEDIEIVYDANVVDATDFTDKVTIVNQGEVTYSWYNSSGVAISAPKDVGLYKIGITVAETENYSEVLTVMKDFEIIKADSSIDFNSDNVKLIYDGNPATYTDFKYTNVGDATLQYEWYAKSNPTVAISAPTEVGEYIFELYYIDNGKNYNASVTRARKEFTISPASAKGSIKIDMNDKDSNSKLSSGDILTANTSAISPTGLTLKYQWKLNGTNISGATSNTYTMPSSYTDGEITVTVSVTGNYTGSFTSSKVGEKKAETPVYNLTAGAMQTVPQNSTTLSFQTDIHHSNFAGIWVDGISRDVNSIATITEGNVKVTLKSSFLNTLPLGEHLISFIAKDGGITSTYFTLTAPVTTSVATPTPKPTPSPTPSATPTITPQPVPEAPTPQEEMPSQTDSNSSFPIIPIGVGVVLAIVGIALIIKKRNADE